VGPVIKSTEVHAEAPVFKARAYQKMTHGAVLGLVS